MPRPIWSGSISFGLVNVPVKMHTAVRKKTIRFHQLHAEDGARIQQKRVCTLDGEDVAYEDLAKGYELSPGEYVVIDPEELDALDPAATQTIDIEDFVSLDDIDPLYYDTSYYLVPDARGAKPYRLLLDAMRDTNRVGIARVVMRTKQYLCAVRPVGDALVLTTMNFADEVVSRDELEGLPGSSETSERELAMARQLVESLATGFEPERYHDTYRQAVMALIEAKAEGQEVVTQPAAASTAPVIDLMAALEASLAASKDGQDKRAAAGGDSAGEPSEPQGRGSKPSSKGGRRRAS